LHIQIVVIFENSYFTR